MNSNLNFEKNLNIFGRFSPDCVEEVRNAKTEMYHLFQAKNGTQNVRKTEPTNFVFHSEDNPEAEAGRWFDSLGGTGEIDGLVVFGIGLGYYYDACKEWLKGNSERYLVFVEYDLTLLKVFFSTEKALELMADPQVVLSGVNKNAFDGSIAKPLSLMVPSLLLYDAHTIFSELNAYQSIERDLWSNIKKVIQIQFNETRTTTCFLHEDFLNAYISNVTSNCWSLLDSKLFYGLQDSLKDIPAVICGAGPSLIDDLQILSSLKDSALILGAGSGMNVLNKHQIFPYLGVGMDPNDTSRSRILTNFSYMVPFCYQTTFNSDALEILHGTKLIFRGWNFYAMDTWFAKQFGLDQYPEIRSQISSTITCVEVARMLGCNPIILAGVDLAYTDKKRYPKEISTHPSDSLEERGLITHIPHSIVMIAKGIEGVKVHTRIDWINEARLLGEFQSRHPEIKLMNATSRGLSIPEVSSISLKEAADGFPRFDLDLDNLIHTQIQNCPQIQFNREEIKSILQKWGESLERCIRLFVELLEEMQKVSNQYSQEDSNFQGNYRTDHFIELSKKILKEDAYTHFVQHIVSHFQKVFFRGQFSFTYRFDHYTERENTSNEMHYFMTLYAFVVHFLMVNKDYISLALKKEPREISYSKQTTIHPLRSNDVYSFVNDHLTISDDELNFSWEEEYKPAKVDLSAQESGIKLFRYAMFAENMPEGQCLIYYPEGKLKGECFYKNGELHGPSTFYSKEGVVLAKGWYIHNKKQGKNIQYYPSGQLFSIKKFLNGQAEGTQEYFDQSGKLQATLNYINGLLHGCISLFYPNGQLKREVHFQKGELEGLERLWNGEGQLILETEFSQNQPTGTSRMWHPDGKLKKEVRYYDNPDHYDLVEWNQQGEICEKKMYVPEDISKHVHEKSEEIRKDIQRIKEDLFIFLTKK